MHSAAALRRELSVRGQQIAAATRSAHELTPGETPSVIFGAMKIGGMEIFIPPLMLHRKRMKLNLAKKSQSVSGIRPRS